MQALYTELDTGLDTGLDTALNTEQYTELDTGLSTALDTMDTMMTMSTDDDGDKERPAIMSDGGGDDGEYGERAGGTQPELLF